MVNNAIAQPITMPVSKAVAPNRIVKAPTTEHMADPNTNYPNRQLNNLYKLWSDGGAGIIITGNVHVDRRYMEGPRNVAAERSDLENPEVVELWKSWSSACKSNGNLAIVQLSHGGRQTPFSVNSQSLAPSPIKLKVKAGGNISPFTTPKEATYDDIQDIIERFVTAAKLCHAAGFDGVQVHAAHGYLLSTFLSPSANVRTDQYGGDVNKRSRVLLEICTRIRKELPTTFTLCVKLNTADFQLGGFSEEESILVSKRLALEGEVDFIEYSGGTYEFAAMMQEDISQILPTKDEIEQQLAKNAGKQVTQETGAPMKESTRKREAFFLDYVNKARPVLRETPILIMLSGGWRSAAAMHMHVLNKNVDLLGIARPICVEPKFPLRVLGWKPGSAENKDVVALPYSISITSPWIPKGVRDTANAQIQAVWHYDQMHRMAKGLSVDFNHSPIRSVLDGTIRMFIDFKKKKFAWIVTVYKLSGYLITLGIMLYAIQMLQEK